MLQHLNERIKAMQKFKLFYCEFPASVHGNARAFVLQKDGYAAIFIDSKLTKEQQEKSLKHELAHLSLDHLNRPLPADADPDTFYIESETYEAEADRYAAEMTGEEFEALMQWAI